MTVALVMSMPGAVDPVAAAPTPSPSAPADPAPRSASGEWVEPTGTGVVRPDFVSASVTARASGQRVEVLSERSEASRTWVQPDGVREAEQAAAPVRYRDPKTTVADGWRDVDVTLVKNVDGSVSPKAVPGRVVLGGAGDSAAALVSVTGQGVPAVSLGAGAGRLLPEPVLDGPTATYPEVLPGVDVRVEVRPTGFEQLWVVKTRAALATLLAAQVGGKKAVAAPLKTGELTATPQSDGRVEFTNKDGKAVSELAPPQVWDAATDASGEPAQVAKAAFALSKGGTPLTPKAGGSGDLELAVVPDQAWLNDQARKFPVTIDPTYASTSTSPIFDTWVQEDETVDKSGSTVLPVGMDSLGVKGRSFLNFSTSPFVGKKIMSASLVLWSTSSGSCTPNGWSSYDSGVASTSTRWTAQPTLGAKFATSTQTKGFSSACPDGSVSIDMKAQLQSWANQAATTKGMTLRSDNETSYTYFHLFHSREAPTNQPVLRWSYNRPPAAMAAPTIGRVVSYTPAGSTTAYRYTSDRRPNLSGVVSDPDGDTAAAAFQASSTSDFATTASSCTSAAVATGSSASCELTTDLAADGRYYLRGRAQDGNGGAGGYSPGQELRVAAVTPAPPVVSCPAPYSNGSWQTTAPTADLTCTISATGTGFSAPSRIAYGIDGNPVYTYVDIPQSSSAAVAKTTVSVSTTAGGHSIRAWALTPTGLGAATSYFLGWGDVPLLKRPNAARPRITTTDKVEMNAAGPAQTGTTAATARTQWRVSGASGTAGWTDAPAGNPLTVAQGGGQSQASGMFDTTTIIGQADASAVTVNGRVPTLIDVRVCITLSAGTGCSGQATVLRVPHAFGSGFPTAGAGPGQVALWTGELSLSESDVDLDTPDESLSVSRSHTSFAGAPSAATQVFGPGWTASFDGDAGVGGAQVWDGTASDGTIAVLNAMGEALVYTTPSGARRTTATLPTGAYKPADDDTQTAGMTLTVSGSGASTVAELTGDDGVVTKFQVTAAPTTAAATFKTVEVREKATSESTTYTYDAAGRVSAITASLPDGVTACAPGSPSNGCRVLKIAYAATTTATATASGDFVGRVKTITAQVNTDADRELAAYKYDNTGRLVEARKSRTGLATSYTWNGSGSTLRLASLTPPGQDPFTFVYDADKLSKVTRPNPASAGGGTAQLAAFVYGVPIAGMIPDLPDLGGLVNEWAQEKAPATGFAVFGQHTPISTAPAAGAAEWKSANLQFTDAEGYTVNAASYGAGDWQLTAADYDDHDHVVRAWNARAIRGIRDGVLPGGREAGSAATLTVYNDDIVENGAVVTSAGTLVTDTYGPVRETAAADGTLKLLRSHTKTFYDQGAPNGGVNPDTGQPYRLPTRAVITAETADGGVDETLSSTLTGYDAVVTGDKTGWELSKATTTTGDMDNSGTVTAGDITKTTRYDDLGREIETRQPKSNGTDAGTRVTTYYTGASSGSACGSKPAWAGMTCRVGPAGQPAGQPVPVITTTGYTWDLQTAAVTETSGQVTSTTTTSYNGQDRATSVTTSVTGLPGSEPVPPTTTSYDPATGEATSTSSSRGSSATTYDGWGRQLTYTNTPAGQAADTATTTYDPAGRTTSVVDNNGATTYVYDGTDANGRAERRGLATAIKVKTTGGTEYTSTVAYDPASGLAVEKLPGNLIRRATTDVVGETIELTVNGQAVDPATGSLAPDRPWLGWSIRSDAGFRTTHQWTPDVAATDGALGATVLTSDLKYRYDRAGCLTRAEELRGDTPCLTRSYTFDANGNRTQEATAPAAADGTCTASGGTTTTRAYDTADRPTTGANGIGTYVYDPLGRQTTIPATDAPDPTGGDLTLSYYDNDAAHSITQGTLALAGPRPLSPSTAPADDTPKPLKPTPAPPPWSVTTPTPPTTPAGPSTLPAAPQRRPATPHPSQVPSVSPSPLVPPSPLWWRSS